ncbi:MAG: aminotransferase class I/II-fold pyridoxal phosphate-dependent enzyme [Bacteroidota bacterium]|nr:aminotransferase class I/II-fold pyridoxal phosphate-dependent enzyme [Bacteroidota bacterium]
MRLSKIAENIIGSEIVKIGNEVNDLKAKGEAITNLTIGDLDANIYPIPTELKTGIQQAYDNNLTNYPPASGLPTLRQSVSLHLKERYNLEYPAKDILIAGGSRPLIYATFKVIVDENDKVIYPIPSWNNNHYTFLNAAQKIEIETKSENNFLPTAEELKPYINQAVLIALCSPLNPTGTMFSKEQLMEICQMIVAENKRRDQSQKPLYLMYDQIYAMLTFDEKHFDPVSLVPEMKDYTIFIDGTSKCFAATGVRVGWCFGPSHVISKMTALLTHVGAWAPKPEQQATADFLRNTTAINTFVEDFKKKIQTSLNTLHQGIQNLKSKGLAVESISPMGAMYLTIKLDYLNKKTPEGNIIGNSSDLVFYLIQTAGLALVPFSAFGNSRQTPWFRASVGGCSLQDINEALPRLEQALSVLE